MNVKLNCLFFVKNIQCSREFKLCKQRFFFINLNPKINVKLKVECKFIGVN